MAVLAGGSWRSLLAYELMQNQFSTIDLPVSKGRSGAKGDLAKSRASEAKDWPVSVA